MSGRADFPVRGVIWAALGTFVFVLLVAMAIYLLFPGARPGEPAAMSAFPGPDLEVSPVADYRDWAAGQAALLAGAEGRVPVGDAMARIVARDDPYAPLPLPEDAPR